jgi:hypothetical protein
LEAMRVAALETNVKQRQQLKGEVSSLLLDVEMQRHTLQHMECELLKLKELNDEQREKFQLLEREVKVHRAKALTNSIYTGNNNHGSGGGGGGSSDSPYPTVDKKYPKSQVTDELIFKLIEAVNPESNITPNTTKAASSLSSASSSTPHVSDLINKLDDLLRHTQALAESEHERAEAESFARQCCEEALNNCKRERQLEVLRADRLKEALSTRVKFEADMETK